MEAVQARMEKLGINGVPQLVAFINGKPTNLNGDILYRGPERLLAAFEGLNIAA